MCLPLLFSFLELFNVAQAAVYPQSRPTSRQENESGLLRGKSPRPTPAPLKQQWFGAIGERDLLPRQTNPSTCGWYSGNPNYPIPCGTGSACHTFNDVEPYYWACCPTSSGQFYETLCPYRSACVNYGDENNANTGDAYTVVGVTVSCGASSPACYTIANVDSSGTTFYYQGCDVTYGYYYAAMYTTEPSSSNVAPSSIGATSSPDATSHLYVITTSSSTQVDDNPSSSSSSSSSRAATTPSSSSSSSSQAATTPSATSTSGFPSLAKTVGEDSLRATSTSGSGTSASKSTPTNKPVNVGAIAGGTVGGVVALALIGAVIGFLMWRKKKARVEPLREVSQYGSSSSPGLSYSSLSQGASYGQGGGYNRGY